MRSVLAVAVLTAVGSAALAEELRNIVLQSRYGVEPAPEFYPQGTPQEALATAVKLLEKQRYSYLLAHMLDPAVVDARVAERVQKLRPGVEKRLAEIRASQRLGLQADTRSEDVIPADPAGFAEKVRAVAEEEAFRELVNAVQFNLSEFPENVSQLATINREGQIAEAGATATAEAKSVPGKKVFLKQVAVAAIQESRVVVDNQPVTRKDPTTVQRWFLEDRQRVVEENPTADK